MRVRVPDKKVENLGSLIDVHPLKTGSGFSLSTDDSPIVLRENSVTELYALDFSVGP